MTWFHLVKSLHVIGVIAWMAGLLYLCRLFAYHASAEKGSVQSETFKVMERRLLRGIMNPAMILAWAMGLLMVFVYPAEAALDWSKGWVHTKALAVVLMTVLHQFYGLWRKDFADRNTRPPRFYKFWNEMPAVLMVVIVIMVIGKPF